MSGMVSRYLAITTSFREITDLVHFDSARCCKVVRDGAPECCFQIADGADLTFTSLEVNLLEALGFGSLDFAFPPREDGMFVLDREVWTPERIGESLNDGPLANTLECASHPTRPVVHAESMRVVGVVVLQACNGGIGWQRYVEHSAALHALWEQAVALVGLKPYYVTERLRTDMRLLPT